MVNSEKIAGIMDSIISENHQIVSSIIEHYSDPNKEAMKEEYEKKQTERYERLSTLYKGLREELKVALSIGEELTRMNYAGADLSEEALEELVFEGKDRTIDSLINVLGEKIQKDFLSMNFIPIKVVNGDTSTMIPSVYNGKPEASLRNYEYGMLISSLTTQFNIIDLEYFMKTRDISKDRLPYSLISILVDEVSDRVAFAEAQQMYENFARNSRENKKDNPCLRPSERLNTILEEVDYKALEEEYRRRFVEETGLLNPYTTYATKIGTMIETGTFPSIVRMSSQEIDDRVDSRVNEYRNQVKENVKQFITKTKGISTQELPGKKADKKETKKKKITSDETVR